MYFTQKRILGVGRSHTIEKFSQFSWNNCCDERQIALLGKLVWCSPGGSHPRGSRRMLIFFGAHKDAWMDFLLVR